MFGRCVRSTTRMIIAPCYKLPTVAPGHLYLIKEREFVRSKEPVYKIGKTTNIKNRMPSYPKNSLLIAMLYCPTDIHSVEKTLIQHFDQTFTKRIDIGAEYYESHSMSHIVHQFVNTLFAEF